MIIVFVNELYAYCLVNYDASHELLLMPSDSKKSSFQKLEDIVGVFIWFYIVYGYFKNLEGNFWVFYMGLNGIYMVFVGFIINLEDIVWVFIWFYMVLI